MIKRKSDEAHAILRQRIMCADLPPGAVIDERALIDEMGIGRTPLRESIVRLEQEGLVVSRGRRGYFVAETSPFDLFRAFELRREIECFAAARAAERRTDADLEAFDAFFARLDTEMADHAEDVAWHLEADEEFHALVAEASDNRFAGQYLSFLFGLSVRSLYLSRVPVTLAYEEMDNYRAVFDAIARRDAPAAEAAMRLHLTINPLQGLMAETSVTSLRKSV
ncbi:MAG: GntR family transcriptional regulator [Paracoccaceae bacterium]